MQTKRNSGGIYIFIHNIFYNNVHFLKQDCDDIIWLRVDGKVFNLPYDLYIYLCYILNRIKKATLN